MSVPTELGRRLSVQQPIHPALAFTICAVPGLVIGAGAWLGATDSLALGVYLFALVTVLLVLMLSGSLFVRQIIHEHGLVLTSVVPLFQTYVVPFATIDPDSIDARRYQRTRGAADPADAISPRYRQAPFVGVVLFVGLTPKLSRRLAKGRITWQSVVALPESVVPELNPSTVDTERWIVGFRANDAVADQLRARVRQHVSGTGR